VKIALQFSKYGGVAAGSALVDYSVFTLFLFFSGGLLPAQMVARVAGGVFSFVLNKYWSFGAKKLDTVAKEGRRFLILYAFSYALALVILYMLTEYLAFKAYPAKIIADVVCFVVNFLVIRRFVFGNSRGLRDRLGSMLKAP
jgi:putative flippase GtrA